MSIELEHLQAKVDDALRRIRQLEEQLDGGAASPPWRYLVERPHPWRKQLCVKGRNMTVGQLVSTMRANHLDHEAAAEDFDLPREAIEEVLRYYEANLDLIQMEAGEERRRLTQRGCTLEPANLPR